jgi:hypothetical protein
MEFSLTCPDKLAAWNEKAMKKNLFFDLHCR